jgi:thiol-disulfide isomerase/thioredoxin
MRRPERGAMAELQGVGQPRSVRAPELPEGLSWFNVDRPLRLHELQGKIVLLHFWTHSRVGCLQLLPELRRLEQKYPRELVVIGVHRAKFPEERETESIRQAILRFSVEHPVVGDRDSLIWRQYEVDTWPTLYLIDPDGMIHGRASGDGLFEALNQAVADLIRSFETLGRLSRKGVAGLRPENEVRASSDARRPGGVLFPGKVMADVDDGRLFVADSGHHRVLEVDLETGMVRRMIGCGTPGLIDGPFRKARFRSPQGLERQGSLLYVADTCNHVLREVDLEQGVVRTVAGTGDRARRAGTFGAHWPGRTTPLNTPSDLVRVGETMYISMTGCHQIWRIDLDSEEVMVHAGSGIEGLQDGPHAQACLAEPGGMTTDGRFLFFVDSETSAVRRAGLGSDGEVATLVGRGLSECGFRDGIGTEADFQHPQGIVWRDGLLYVADTYNNAVRTVHPGSGQVRTLIGPGQPGGEGADDDRLAEPAGIETTGTLLVVADTNHHRLRRFLLPTCQSLPWDVQDGEIVSDSTSSGTGDLEGYAEDQETELGETVLASGAAHLHFDLRLPAGYKLNRAAPFELTATGDGVVAEVSGGSFQLHTGDPNFPVTIPLQLAFGNGFLRLQLMVYYCEMPEETLCYYQIIRLRAPIRAEDRGAKPEARVVYQLAVPTAPI